MTPVLPAHPEWAAVTRFGTRTITLLERMSWLGGRGTRGDLGVEESPDFTEQGDC